MAKFLSKANDFFNSCESGRSEEAQKHIAEGALFECDALPTIATVKDYTEWMKGIGCVVLAPSRYELHSVTSNENTVIFYATFYGTHNGEGGPVPPTGKSVVTAYVYVLTFDDSGNISKMVKVWNVGDAFKQLGWA
mmetsp:Transcript_16690/g.28910  ORF Transcript_16690/g.28910 Transcript_16690/m.28910 type:complete len:136 (-) Transcript_16690:472-879(-)|eukprot:CAMPEP_0196653822 /NCGR_PEP_ID=MMETSP1086-20130531/3477_1 /TAXON_ID=77921 /ORGANISM="Cyanoptyche  gloeocystis , Strain SAG4.97" /LENGTH=135 /DNA_ID=CAMNT_0041985211 /DNA_START=190 /DNA_END=597 /DNA_ORIENTATION=-